MTRTISLFAIVLVALAAVGATQAVEPQTGSADAAVDYILSQQNADGGFTGFAPESAPGVTLDAVFALVAAGVDPTTVEVDGNSPLDYLETQAVEYSADPGSASKLAYAVQLAGLNAADFAGVDLVDAMEDAYDNETGKYGVDLFDHAFYLFALAAMGGPVPPPAIEYLTSIQLDDGGWEFDTGFASDSNTTAMVVQALLASDVANDDPAIADAVGYFASIQDSSAAFAFLADTDPDAQSTAFVIQALIAAGEDLDEWAVDGMTPMDALLAFQNPESGAIQFAAEDSPFATYQVVPGLLLAPFPELVTLPDGEPSQATDEPTEEPMVTDQPADLPNTGAGPAGGATPWWAVPALLGCAATAGAGAVAVRRR